MSSCTVFLKSQNPKILVHAKRQGLISDKNVQKYSNQKDFRVCTTVVNTLECIGQKVFIRSRLVISHLVQRKKEHNKMRQSF